MEVEAPGRPPRRLDDRAARLQVLRTLRLVDASLFAEVRSILRPGGVFANLEVVQCATPELQDEFYRRIDRAGGDPEDVLAGVHEQLGWMRSAGLVQVDCFWRWRGFALLVGHAPAAPERAG